MNNNLNQNGGMQKRLILMTVLVFVFFIAYEFLVLKPQQEQRKEQARIAQEQNANAAPDVAMSSTSQDLASVNSANAAPMQVNKIVSTITTSKNIIEIDNLGRVAQVTLLEEKYKSEDGSNLKLYDNNQLRPLETRFANSSINSEAFKVDFVASSSNLDASSQTQELILTQTLSGTTFTKKLTFYPDGHYDLEASASNGEQFFITNGYRPNVKVDMYAVHGLMAQHRVDDSLEVIDDGDLSSNKTFQGMNFVSNFDRYYASVVYNFDKALEITLMPDAKENPNAFIHANGNISFSGWMGPKNFNDLKALNPKLTDVIDYGWFTFIAKPMFTLLQFIQSYVGNWGWTIVILTILIKLVLYPLSYKGMVGMQKLKDLAPKMKEIQAKYKDDKQRQSMAMMELYKKHGANPMGGCLPLLLQIPVFFAIYRVLINAIELKGAEWILWIHDLAEMDPWFVLPILMGATMFIQQKITPTAMQDELQKKIFQMLPIIFTFFFIWFPAGLTLYWFVNNLFTIAQQYTINRIFEKKRVAKANS